MVDLTIYFFCVNRDIRRNNPLSILRGMLTLLLTKMPGLIKHLLATYNIQGARLFEQNSFESLWAIFLDVVNDTGIRRVSCIIDGLDECEPTPELEGFLTKIKTLPTAAPRLGLIAVSHEYPKCLHMALGRSPRIRLDPDHGPK